MRNKRTSKSVSRPSSKAATERAVTFEAHWPQLVRDRRLGFPTVAIESSFSAPLVYGDVAVVEINVERMGKSSVVFGYEIRRKRDGVLCFSARVTTVLVSIDTMEPIALNAEYRSLFERLLGTKR